MKRCTPGACGERAKHVVWSWMLVIWLAAGVSAPATAAVLRQPQGNEANDLERLLGMLQSPGADGKLQRETAVERLLGMPEPQAHRELQQRLLRQDDPDGVRLLVLTALQRHLVGNSATLFGGANAEVRRQIVTGYLAALAPLWRDGGSAVEDATSNPVRAAARQAMQRVPPRELEAAAHVVLASSDQQGKLDVLRCLADMQQVLFARTIAEFLEDPDVAVRAGARRALQLLTYSDEALDTKAQFDAWYERFGTMRYVDLVEQAARGGPRPLERLRADMARLRIEAARDVVRAHVVRTPGVDWAAIQSRTVVDDPAVLDACLETLQQALATEVPVEDAAGPRQAFCRALLQRFRKVEHEQVRRRALLLEVAAYLVPPAETDLAGEVVALLLAQLDEPKTEVQLAALRSLRRFPTVETRTRLVRHAAALLGKGPAVREQLLAVLATLSSRAVPRWCAPQPTDPDKAEWFALVTAACRSGPELELRDAALSLAQTLDSAGKRVPEVFGLLLDMARDTSLDVKFRSTCVIHLQGWRNEPDAVEAWVRANHALLADPAPELRQLAAESLARLPESVDSKRADWIGASIIELRKQLETEPNPAVLRALVNSLQVCGREPQMPEKAIGALNTVLFSLGNPVPPEQLFRLEPLLQALATIAADSRADRGQWIGACRSLLLFDKRQSVRLVIQSHGAIDLAGDVGSTESSLAERARQAMEFIIGAAVLKSPKEAWNSTEELKKESREVRNAFGALDSVGETKRVDEPKHRLLRLEVDLANGKYQDVVTRASAWIAAPIASTSTAKLGATVEQRDRMRFLAAEAHLALGKPDQALRMLAERNPDAVADAAVLDLQSRIARALFAADPATALDLSERVLRATPNEDPAYRVRLLDWLQNRIRHSPATREATLKEAAQHASLFAGPDCPAELREAFEQLRAAR